MGSGNAISVGYSCVQGGHAGYGNISANPTFERDPDDGGNGWNVDDVEDYGDLRPTSLSPCLDAGSNDAVAIDAADLDGDGNVAEPVPYDLAEVPRLGDTDVDMGAYEYHDCNTNAVRDHVDIALGTSLDCNQNRYPDECDLAGSTSQDCNTNTIPDECDLAAGLETDCNENGVPDACDLAGCGGAPWCQDCNSNGVLDGCEIDCNTNGVPDDCDIAGLTSEDCNSNGVPDECEVDCNTNGIPDDCDIAGCSGDPQCTDCDGNGILDWCELYPASGPATAADCNTNNIVDGCELPVQFIAQSRPYSPLAEYVSHTYTRSTVPPASCRDVLLRFRAFGDLDGQAKTVAVKVNGQLCGHVFNDGLTPWQPCVTRSAKLVIPGEVFNDLVTSGGGLQITMTPAAGVSPTACSGSSWIEVTVNYRTPVTVHDMDSDGVPDECNPDCNGNDLPDGYDLYWDTSLDCNGSWIPDECEMAGCGAELWCQDCNSNGLLDGCEEDCNGNGIPDDCDLSTCTGAAWCSDCNSNGVIDACDLPSPVDVVSERFFNFDWNLSVWDGLPTVAVAEGRNATLTFTCYADLQTPGKWVYVYAGNSLVFSVFQSTAPQCSEMSAVVVMSAEEYNSAFQPGTGTPLRLQTSSGPPWPWCDYPSWIRVRIEYEGAPVSQDCNANGIPDECDWDCNGNGIPDDCDPICRGDTNCDGVINGSDLDFFYIAVDKGCDVWVAEFYPNVPTCSYWNNDVNGDGVVDGFEDEEALIELLGTSCP